MNLSTLFRLRENLNLDRKTLFILRWIAIIGQLTAINLVYFYLKLLVPIQKQKELLFLILQHCNQLDDVGDKMILDEIELQLFLLSEK